MSRVCRNPVPPNLSVAIMALAAVLAGLQSLTAADSPAAAPAWLPADGDPEWQPRISAEEAREIGRRCRSWEITLPNVCRLDSSHSVAIAHSLASSTGFVALPNLRATSPLALAALQSKSGMVLPPPETIELLPEP